MIDLYYHPTPNTWKVAIFLEEAGMPYRVRHIHILRGDQLSESFRAINPNQRVPAIVDPDGPDGPVTVFESGAILVYLAEKTGRFLPRSGAARYDVLQWLFWQMGGLGPMAGQAHHFRLKHEMPYGKTRYTNETARLYGVMNDRLADRDFLARDYSIADMACVGWINMYRLQGQNLADFPHLRDWFQRMRARPGVRRGLLVGAEFTSDEGRKLLGIDDVEPA